MTRSDAIRGLYAVTDARLDEATLLQRAEAVLSGGAGVLQYRDKSADAERRRRQARALLALCRRFGACFIINDDPALAAEIGADGVHVGEDDDGVAAARAVVGDGVLIGVSCYGDLDRADRMQAAGADYLAFGSVYPSPTKPDAPRASLQRLAEARARYALPLVAIGGITEANAAPVIATGVDAVAVISALFDAPDPAAAASRLAAGFGA